MNDNEIHRAAVRAVEHIASRLRDGKIRQDSDRRASIQVIRESIRKLGQIEPTFERTEHVALSHQLLGNLLLAGGNIEDGIDALVTAGECFASINAVTEHHARYLHDFAVVLHELSVPKLPLTYATQSADMMAQLGITHIDGKPVRIEDFLSSLDPESESNGTEETLGLLRDRLAKASRQERAERAQALAVGILDRQVGKSHLDELHHALKIAFQSVWRARRNDVGDVITVLRTSIELYWQKIPMPVWLFRAIQRTRKYCLKTNRLDLLPDLEAIEGVYLLSLNSVDEALHALLRSVAWHDEDVLRTESSALRGLTGHVNDYARQFALSIAIDQGDAPLIAELIETSRLQAEPLASEIKEPSVFERSRVGKIRPISVMGTSRLLKYYRDPAISDPVELIDCIDAVGGPTPAWWGTYSINERIYWILLLEGSWSFGQLSLSDGDHLRELFASILRLMPQSGHATMEDILQGPLCRTSFSEERASLELGEALIPPRLKALIQRTPTSNPISLVVSGNFFSLLPIALLGVEVDILTTRRLVEAAIIRVAPPAWLVNRVRMRESSRSDRYPIRVACVDPRGDLRNSRTVPEGSEMVLSGDPLVDVQRPTLHNLQEALSKTPAGAPNLFYYSGHVAQGGLGGDDRDALALFDGDLLSARRIFSIEADHQSIPFPSRVMMSACASSGAQGAGAGEWLGLTAAMLWSGAHVVVSTLWPILDTPFTSNFDNAIADDLQGHADPAEILRMKQINALSLWRASDHDFSSKIRSTELSRLPLPIIWAAYVSVGIS